MEERVEQSNEHLITTVIPIEIIGRGMFGTVYTTETPDIVVKLFHNPDRFFVENPQYIIASDLGFGVLVHGWCKLQDNRLGIVMEKMDAPFDTENIAEIPKLLQLMVDIAESGYFCADFHALNIMVKNTELKLIDPSLISTEKFISTQKIRGKLPENGIYNLVDISLGLMVDYITNPIFGGILLKTNLQYYNAFVAFMQQRIVLLFDYATGGWEHRLWSV